MSYFDALRCRAFIPRLKAIPGVTYVAVTSLTPFSGGSSTTSFQVEGRPIVKGSPRTSARRRATTPEFFRTVGIPIIEGHAYTDADRAGTTPVIVISRTFARNEWPGESARGARPSS